MSKSKTPGQLDREIAESLGSLPWAEMSLTDGNSSMGIGSVSGGRLTAKRAKDFRDSGNYEVRDESGAFVALLYRDPERREWYEDSLPGDPQTHYVDRWRGFTQADALESIARRRKR